MAGGFLAPPRPAPTTNAPRRLTSQVILSSAIFQSVFDLAPNPAATAASEVIPGADTKRRILTAFLSALAPGAGQLLVGLRRRGVALLVVFAALISCIWPLRLPRFYAPFVLVVLTWAGLSIYASSAALLEHRNGASQRPSKWWLLAIPLLAYLGFNLVFTPLFLVAGFRAFNFPSSSMEPNLLAGDRFVSDRDYYHHHPVLRGDLLVLRVSDYQTVKRVVAVGGDTIEGRNRKILVNGRLVDEPFIQHSQPEGSNLQLDSFGPVRIPADKYFVMGDNRDISLDSRMPNFGLVDARAIVGRPLYVYRSRTKGRTGKKLN